MDFSFADWVLLRCCDCGAQPLQSISFLIQTIFLGWMISKSSSRWAMRKSVWFFIGNCPNKEVRMPARAPHQSPGCNPYQYCSNAHQRMTWRPAPRNYGVEKSLSGPVAATFSSPSGYSQHCHSSCHDNHGNCYPTHPFHICTRPAEAESGVIGVSTLHDYLIISLSNLLRAIRPLTTEDRELLWDQFAKLCMFLNQPGLDLGQRITNRYQSQAAHFLSSSHEQHTLARHLSKQIHGIAKHIFYSYLQ